MIHNIKYMFATILLSTLGVTDTQAMVNTPVDSLTLAAIDKINDIKLDTKNYLYAEVTMADWEKAYENAKVLLKEKVELWLAENGEKDNKSYVAKSEEKFLEIKSLRGNLYRAFVYVKKKDIVTFSEARQIICSIQPALEDVEKKEDGEKTEETPTTPNSSTNITEPAPEVETAEAQERVEQETVAAKEISEEHVSADNAVPQQVNNTIEEEWIVKSMLQITKFEKIESFVKSEKEDGRIKEYGKYATRPKEGLYYLFVYNPKGEIPAYLECKDGKLFNLKTQQQDMIENYKGCGAFWFTPMK